MNWRLLAKLGLVGAAPFTGGASLAALPATRLIPDGKGGGDGGGDTADMVSGMASALGGAAKDRNAAKLDNEKLDISRFLANLQAKEYMRDSAGARAHDATKGSMVANFQPSQVSMPTPGYGLRGETPTFSGGFNNPNMFADAKEAGRQSAAQNTAALINHTDTIAPVEGQPDSMLDKILGYGAFGGSLLDTYLQGMKKKTPIMTGDALPGDDILV